MSLEGKTDIEKLKSLSNKTYKQQAVWFLNGFWHIHSAEAEKVWSGVQKLVSLDLQNGAEGTNLDELQMHRFLESFQETMTVKEMRDNLRSTGAIEGNSKAFPITYYYIYKYGVDWHKLVHAAQGDNQKEIDEAQNMLNQVQNALQESQKAVEDSKQKIAESKAKAAESKVAQAELEVALAEVKKQEDEFNNKTNDLKRKSEEGSVVQQNKAKNELAQHLASDPLPLRKAKITLEAAVKKSDRAFKAAISAGNAAEEAKKSAEEAVEKTQVKYEEAENYLKEVKSKPGSAAGQIWWMERELHEAKKYIPERKGGIRK
eukprot:TRINITY_DN1383_c0_g1_i3.p1 TRINITY_DN1383_c0_g1~~TRINITY_DN1383_c0_g1_i3.p1  ORF type:complete len:317 (-),score=168.69 TRINITY_DN1383_c0_g1_i3:79-1029(-)